MKKIWKSKMFWEILGYVTLALCIFGQITVGTVYLLAQFAYLIANCVGVVRDFALKLPNANKVRDVVFAGITIALIVIRIVK